MKYLASLALALAVVGATLVKRDNAQGINVEASQGKVDWQSVANNGTSFAFIKATEGIFYTSPSFSDQYNGAADAGLIRGAFHCAQPDMSSGADQANYFIDNGGDWSGDGITLPGVMHLEFNSNGDECYGMAGPDMILWMTNFSDTYYNATTRYPVIYTTTSWWSDCTGDYQNFGGTNALWIVHWASSPYPIPSGWFESDYTVWQYSNSSSNPGDADQWNGDYDAVVNFAYGN